MRFLVGTTAVVLFLVQGLQGQAGDARKDKELLQGTWVATSVSLGGKEEKQDFILTFKGDKSIRTQGGSDTEEYDFALDPTRKPKEIDFKLAKRKGTDKGIYDLQGDTLKIAILYPDDPDGPRPTEFSGKNVAVVTLKRKK